MATNLGINDKLLVKAQRIGGHRTKRDTVNAALEEYVRNREQLDIAKLFGTVEFHPDYDHKLGRRKR
jgi:Arc/MetJ family transcription regulator